MPMVSEKVPLALGKPLSSNHPVLHIKIGPRVKRLSKFEHWIVEGVKHLTQFCSTTEGKKNQNNNQSLIIIVSKL